MTTPAQAARTAMLCGPWALFGDVPPAISGDHTEADWTRWLTVASEILFWLSGERWSGTGCTYTAELRGHPPEPGSGAWPYYRTWGLTNTSPAYWWLPVGFFPWWPTYRAVDPRPYAVKLPHDEVSEITSVTINGVAFTDYQLVKGSWLERTDGRSWLEFLDQTQISYDYGTPPPESGVAQCITLASELGKAECGDNSCRLPKRVTSVVRQGVTVAMIDSMDFYKQRKTGLPDVDLWLAAVNPEGRKRRARVFSPDIPRAR